MTENEAKIIMLEQLLLDAYSTISFLDGCLTSPETFKYWYPEHTRRTLDRISKIVPIPDTCCHSHFDNSCPCCHNNKIRTEEYHVALKILNISE